MPGSVGRPTVATVDKRAWVRRVVIAGLGVALIVDSLVGEFKAVELILGAIMAGLFPLDFLLDAWAKPDDGDEEQLARLRQVMRDRDGESPPPPSYPDRADPPKG
jgi:hypothetical protein